MSLFLIWNKILSNYDTRPIRINQAGLVSSGSSKWFHNPQRYRKINSINILKTQKNKNLVKWRFYSEKPKKGKTMFLLSPAPDPFHLLRAPSFNYLRHSITSIPCYLLLFIGIISSFIQVAWVKDFYHVFLFGLQLIWFK